MNRTAVHNAWLICLCFVFLHLFLVHSQKPLLTVSFTSGDINLMNSYDDLSPILIHTALKGVCAFVINFVKLPVF